MKNALILHGSGNNSQGNWYPWLKKCLEEKGWTTWLPDLPNASHPDMDEGTQYIFSNRKWRFNPKSVIIGHSSGATLSLGILEKLPSEIIIDKAILVAGFVRFTSKPEVNEIMKGSLKKPFHWNKIKRSAKQFYFIHSDNDPYECDVEQGKIMHEYLGGQLIIKKGQGHFNLEKGPEYKKFPLILEILNEK